jgi:hypothetical protein
VRLIYFCRVALGQRRLIGRLAPLTALFSALTILFYTRFYDTLDAWSQLDNRLLYNGGMQASVKTLMTRHQFAFPKLLAYRVQMVLAYQILAVTVGWHIYEITRDPFSLGLIGLAEVIPYFATALFAGHAVDHHFSRRGFGMLAAALLCINAATLVLLTQGWLGGSASLWIYGSIAMTGFARAFIAPSYNTLFALIIPRGSFGRGSGHRQFGISNRLDCGTSAWRSCWWALLIKRWPMALATALCLGAVLAMLSLRLDEPAPVESPPVLKSIAQGLRFVWGNQIVFGAQMLDMFAVLFGGAVAMLPAFVHDVYHMGPEGLGILRAAPAVGAIVTGLWLARHPINLHAGRWLLGAVAGFGLCMIGFALTVQFWLAFACLMLSGVLDGISVVMRQTIVQLATPDHMRGRVSSINGIFIGSSNELGAFESGVAAKLMGLVPSVVFGGLMTIGVVGVTAKLAPKLRELELDQLK